MLFFHGGFVELVNLKENTYYFDNQVVIGLYMINEKDCLLIDSGLDKDTFRKLSRILDDKKINPKYIFNTHHHADHIGGNKYFKEKYNSIIICGEIEKAFIENTYLETFYIYGAKAPESFKSKFILSEKSSVDIYLSDDVLELDGHKFKILELYGHSIGLLGIVTPDNVCFLSDSVLGNDILSKHKIAYNYDVKTAKVTLNKIREFSYEYYVLAHGGIIKNIDELCKLNIDNIDKINELIIQIIQNERSISIENIHMKLSNILELNQNPNSYFLNKSTVSSHITMLVDEKKIAFEMKDNLFVMNIV
jgi:glyoxylase-like metal-dependent hydrolase (beta-lactamase superfamily II)